MSFPCHDICKKNLLQLSKHVTKKCQAHVIKLRISAFVKHKQKIAIKCNAKVQNCEFSESSGQERHFIYVQTSKEKFQNRLIRLV